VLWSKCLLSSALDLNLFRVFAAIYRERNLTRAAEMLCVSQSAVSHALARLREQLGDALFVREGHGVVPTALASRLRPDIEEALALLNQVVHQSLSFEPERDISQVTLAMNDELELSLLPLLVPALRAVAPEVSIASVRLDRDSLRADLAAGRLDCAIDIAQATANDMCHTFLARDNFVVVSRAAAVLTRADYLAARHITVSSRRSGLAVEDIALSRLGLSRQVVLRCQHYEAACRIVTDSDLLLTMPQRQAMAINITLGNTLQALPLPLPEVELHLYWHRQRDADPANRWLREQLIRLMLVDAANAVSAVNAVNAVNEINADEL
jgi:DNA-binding transcriptional LysR family regulator